MKASVRTATVLLLSLLLAGASSTFWRFEEATVVEIISTEPVIFKLESVGVERDFRCEIPLCSNIEVEMLGNFIGHFPRIDEDNQELIVDAFEILAPTLVGARGSTSRGL